MEGLQYLDPPRVQAGRLWWRILLPLVFAALAIAMPVAAMNFRLGVDAIALWLFTAMMGLSSIAWILDEVRNLSIVLTRDGVRQGVGPAAIYIPWAQAALESATKGVRITGPGKSILVTPTYFKRADFWAFFNEVDEVLEVAGLRRASRVRLLMTPAYTLNDADLSAFLDFAYRSSWPGAGRVAGNILSNAFFMSLIGIWLVSLGWVRQLFPMLAPLPPLTLIAAVAGVSLIVCAVLFVIGQPGRRRRQHAALKTAWVCQDPHAVSVCSAGVIHSNDYYDEYFAWHQFSTVHDLAKLIVLMRPSGAVLIVPKRIFSTSETAAEFCAQTRAYHRAGISGTAEIIPIR